ncbi:MAG: cyclic nucleotide-binding domain-containing protein [Calditrichaeota bacterium]|nr:cyclic nucleotide-binding domain-containing protein [Calditrichota bacterium]
MQISDILQQVPFFKSLSENDIEYVVQKLEFKTYNTGAYICKIDEPGDKMFIIISGGVRVMIIDADESETEVAQLDAGNYFGEMALLTNEPRTASVLTRESSEMFILHKKDFDEIVERFPIMQIELGKIMSQRLKQNLAKAMEMSKKAASRNIEQKTATGKLSPEKTVVDLMGFCDQKSLSGDIILKSGDQTGTISYDGGQIIKVILGSKQDDEALDELLGWEGGTFTIKPREVSFDELIGGGAPVSDDGGDNNTILVVSNSLVVRKLLERKLSEMSFTVKAAKNISSAIDIISNQAPKIVIADMKFDDGNVTALSAKIHEKADVPIVVISDGNMSPDLQKLSSSNNVKVTSSHDIAEVAKIVKDIA